MPVFMRGKPVPYPLLALPLSILIFAFMAMPVLGLETLQVTIDGRPVQESITMPYSGPEGDPVSALAVKVTGVSGAVRFVIDPADSQGCKNGEWEHASRELMVAHYEQTNYYRAPASDWHPCSSVRLGVIHDESGQEVWWTVNFAGSSKSPSEETSGTNTNQALYEIDPGISSGESIAAVEKVLWNGEDVTAEHTLLYEGGRIRTGPGLDITIRYHPGAQVRIRENSEMEIKKPTIIKDNIRVINSRLINGILDFWGWSEKSKAEKKFEFETDTAVTSIKGTQFTLAYSMGKTTLQVFEGEVEFMDKFTGDVIKVRAGESVVSGGSPEEIQSTPAGENLALGKEASQSSTAMEWGGKWDASRGVDGVKTGNLFEGGFHTDNEQNPWWQVDLGSIYEIAEVRIYNRLDCCSDRAKTIEVLLSEDGESWRNVYSHNGSTFGGADGNYLCVNVDGQTARYVRVQLQEKNWLHLDEVEVYARGGVRNETGAEPTGTNVGWNEGGSVNPEGLSPEGLNKDILGQWTIYSGGQVGTPEEWDARYRGTLSLSSWEGTYQGTVMYDIYQTKEELTEVTYQDGVLRFTRPPFLGRYVPQFFEAKVEGERMEGTFSEEGDSRHWRWWGTLDSRSNGEIQVFL